jgi:hypothetical protein
MPAIMRRALSPFEVWLREKVERWLAERHPQALTWNAKAEALGLHYSIAYPFLGGEKGLSSATAAKLIEKIGGNWRGCLPSEESEAPVTLPILPSPRGVANREDGSVEITEDSTPFDLTQEGLKSQFAQVTTGELFVVEGKSLDNRNCLFICRRSTKQYIEGLPIVIMKIKKAESYFICRIQYDLDEQDKISQVIALPLESHQAAKLYKPGLTIKK